MIDWLADFHFLRPWWLLAVIPGVLLALSRHLLTTQSSSWSQVIAPSLLPFLTRSTGQEQQRRRARWVLVITWTLICIGLAGPTAAKLPQPLQRDTNALVVLFDLSPSMRVRDLAPDRLTRARLKTIDFLRERREGMTGLVIYAGDAFTLAPMTPDLNTVLHLIPELEPEIMPSPGSYVEAALRQGLELMLNAGHRTGRVLLVTDGVSHDAQQSIDQLMRQFAEYRLDILGVGTADGGPVPLPDGSFARGADGRIVVEALPQQRLRNLAQRAGGRYATLTADDRDLEHLLTPYRHPLSDNRVEPALEEFDLWHDLGYWLALALLPLIVVLFRRGVLASLLVLLPLTFHSPPAAALSWHDLWATPDQRASRALANGDAAQAASEFQDPAWRGVAAYASGDYAAAEQLFAEQDSADAHYNRGNALAAQGRFAEALDAYDAALARDPQLAAAQHNRERAQELLQQQEQEQQDQPDQSSGDASPEGQPTQSQDPSQEQPQDRSDRAEAPDSTDESAAEAQPSSEPEEDSLNADDSVADTSSADTDAANNAEPTPETSPEDPAQTEDHNADTPQPEGGRDIAEETVEETAEEIAEDTANETGDAASAGHDPRDEQMEQQLRRVPEDPGGLLRRQLQREALLRARESQRVRSGPPGSEQERW